MSEAAIQLLRAAVADAGYRVGPMQSETTFIAESPERAVWCAIFATPTELLESWQDEQAAAIDQTQTLSAEKAWDLYLVLASELEPDDQEELTFDAIRRDTSYARKILVPGTERQSPGSVASYLAPLSPLEIPEAPERPDALQQLETNVREGDDEDAVEVLDAFKENKPLFGEL